MSRPRVVADQLSDMLSKARGLKPAVVEGPPPAGEAAIVLARGASDRAKAEAYALDVAPTGVTITAAKRAGLFYGAVSVWQLAVQDAAKGPAQLPAVSIDDAPRFAWRGFMLDSARHFQSVETIKAILDAMAAHKLNDLHWHLVDDQGWRLEIKKYPKLTRRRAWRVPAARRPGSGPASRSATAASTPRTRCATWSPTPPRAASPSSPRSRCPATPWRRSSPIPSSA
jgi:hexosaminidase